MRVTIMSGRTGKSVQRMTEHGKPLLQGALLFRRLHN
jgi:hypothetical protein